MAVSGVLQLLAGGGAGGGAGTASGTTGFFTLRSKWTAMKESRAFKMHILGQTQAEAVGHIERRRAFLGMGIKWILWIALGNRTSGTGASDHRARVINGLTPGITRLYARPTVTYRAGKRSLQRMISGVGCCSNDILHPKPPVTLPALSNCVPGANPALAPG